MNTNVLRDIGLNDSEIKVYFTLLELESSTVGPIISGAVVPDSKIYIILKKLHEKGLVSYVIKNKVKHFRASDPKNLLEIISDKEKKLSSQKKEIIDEIIPWFETRKKTLEDKQEATVYESYDGIKTAFNLILNTLEKGEEYYVFGLGEILKEKKLIYFFKTYHEKRLEKGISLKMILEKKHKIIFEKHHLYKGMNLKYVNNKYPVGTYIFKNYVMTVIWGNVPTAFVIKSKQNYEQYKSYFEDTWNRN